MDHIYQQEFLLEAPLTASEDSGPFDNPLTIGLILGGALLFLLIVLTLAARYS